jgi:hypothetical protein
MYSIILFLFFLGIFIIIHNIYDQKYEALKKNVRVEYRFIPRTYYEEQISNSNISALYKNMFDKESPWFEDNVTLSKTLK